MNADRLLQLYERIADAPDAVKRLRRFILDLTVRGKLTSFSYRVDDVQPLGKLSEFIMGQAPPGNSYNEEGVGTVFVKVGEFGERYPKHAAWTTDPLKFAKQGDVLICVVGATIGKLNLAIDCAIGRSVAAVRPNDVLNQEFLYYSLMPVTLRLREGSRGTAQGVISRPDLASIPIWLPPLAEQKRIVAKVDELMAFCDRLDEAQTEREATRDRLTTASLTRLGDPDPETFHDDARFALYALPAMAARADQIKQLRQTILNLAVRGKLVSQDPNDEPINLKADDCEERPDAIPKSWFYVRLVKLLAEDTRNGYSRKPDDARDGTPILRISAGTVRRDGVVAEEEHKLISAINPSMRLQYGLKSGDLLACRFNGNKAFVGRLTVFKDYLGLLPIYPDKLIRVRIARNLAMPEFLQIAGDTDFVRTEVEAACATTVGNWGISATNLKEIRFPLPPLAEQKRIVAKVDELMALCDRLEASLTAGENARSRLLNALLHEALEPASTELEVAA
jgi:type I restriction enzyme S subunit